MSPVPCPACQRPNAPGRAACLYCGADLPTSGEAPADTGPRTLPADLDRLVARALAGGGMGEVAALRRAMEQARREAPPPPPARPDGPGEVGEVGEITAPPAEERPAQEAPAEEARAEEARAEEPSPADPLGAALAAFADRAVAARDAWERGDPAGARAALAAALEQATPADGLPLAERLDRAAAPPIPLPPVHRSHALVIAGLADGERALDVARALETDVATARQLVLARAPKVARRADEADSLAPLAARLRELGVPAAVVTRAELQAQPPAALVLGLAAPDDGPLASPWRLEWSDRWTRAHDPGPDSLQAAAGAVTAPLPAPRLAVPGEVVIRRRTAGRDLGRMTHRRHQQGRDLGERRVPVLDLHGPGFVWRLVHGLTDLRGVVDAPGGLRAFQALVDALPGWFPELRVLPSRTVVPTRDRPLADPAGGEDARARRVQELSGWPAWEEHSRLARVLHAPERGTD